MGKTYRHPPEAGCNVSPSASWRPGAGVAGRVSGHMAGVMQRESWLPASPESARLARAIVREAASELGVSDSDAWDLMLATTEAFANAVEHGSACGKEGAILLRLEPREDGLCVEVRDCGSFHVSRPPESLEATRGRGIPLMAAVVDQLELLPGGSQTRVRFRKHVGVA